jgi:FkbM family methyltransferase
VTTLWSNRYEAWYRENSRDLNVFKEQHQYHTLDIQPGDVALDLGGHIGAFALMAAHAGATQVVSYEPEPENFELLLKNIERYPQCSAVRAAVVASPAPKTVDFYVVVPPSGKKLNCSHSLFLSEKKSGTRWPRKKIMVTAVGIEEVLAEVKPTVIKSDVEGAEFMLFEKLELPSGVRAIAIEMHYKEPGRAEAYRLADSLSRQGFLPSRIPYLGLNKFPTVGVWSR